MFKTRQSLTEMVLGALTFFICAGALTASEQPAAASERTLKWRSGVVKIAVSSSVLNGHPGIRGDVLDAIRKSVAAWNDAANLEIAITESDLQTVSAKGIRGDGISLLTIAPTAENQRLFPKQGDSPAATTRIFFDRLGLITEADIVLNPFVQFSTDGTFGTYDLQATLTHELGHLLGLDHSNAVGARMFERVGKNTAWQTTSSPKRLSAVDIAAIRSLYGAKIEDFSCCGSVAGSILRISQKDLGQADVWLEERSTGRVVASSTSGPDGRFRISGVDEGEYVLYVQSLPSSKRTISGKTPVNVTFGDDARANVSANVAESRWSPEFVGLNAQLARLPVRLAVGQSARLYVGGTGRLPGTSMIGFSSPLLRSASTWSRLADFGSTADVLSIDVTPDLETPAGEYTIFSRDLTGSHRYLIGAVVLDEK